MATKWLSASDPYFQQFTGTQDEGGFQPGQYAGQIAGLNSPAMWEPLARQLGYTGEIMGVVGTDAEGGALTDYSNEFKNFIAQKKAEGYDLVTDASKIDQRKQTVGLRLPSGQVVGERSVDAGGFGEFLQAAMMMFGPVFGGQIFNALTGAGTAAGSAIGATNALTPAAIEAGLGTAGYGANASAAASGLFNPAVIGAGAGLPFESMLPSGGAGTLAAGDVASLSPDVRAGGDFITGDGLSADLGSAGGGDFLSGMSDVAATEGAGVSGTGILTQGTNIPSAVLGGNPILDQAISLIKSPAGGAILGGAGSLVGGIMQANAAEAAAEQQAGAAQNALALQREMFEYQKGLLEPYRTAGTSALKRLEGALGLGGQAQPQQMLEMDPGYGFRLGEGMKALERMQAARGNMLSGGAMKAGQRYAQDYASGEYGNAYNRLANIAGLGQTTGTQLGTAAQQFGTNASGVMGQEANALAAGRVGRGSAYAGGVQGGLNAYSNYLNQQQQNQMFRDIFGRTAIGG